MTLLVVTGLRREANIAAREHIVTVSGGGNRESLERQIAAALDNPIRGIVSFGIAGALAPHLKPGDCIVASHVIDGDQIFSCDEAWLRAVAAKLPDAQIATMAGTDSILADVAGKTALYARTGAAAADMESHIAARAARAKNLPFIVLRTISDGADRALPPATLAALKPDGTLDAFAIARSLLAKPGQIPSLIRTGRESEQAFAGLLRCRGRLGPLFAFPDLG
jgi:hopanoid-associated phosphorylase